MPESLKPYAGGVFPDPDPPTPDPEPRCCRCKTVRSADAHPEPRCCRCKTVRSADAPLFFRQTNGVNYVVCRGCASAEQKERKAAAKPWCQKLPASPEVIAKRMEALNRARLTRKERIDKIRTHVLTDGVPVNNRQYQVLLMHLGGIEPKDIALALGYANGNTVNNILRQPHLRAAIEKVERARLERIISGDFGVQAQARAASPKAMKRIVAEVDEAPKAGDRIKAAEDVLKVAGEMVEKKAVHHVFEIVNGMTEAEMEEYLAFRRWPERVRGLVEKLGLPDLRTRSPVE